MRRDKSNEKKIEVFTENFKVCIKEYMYTISKEAETMQQYSKNSQTKNFDVNKFILRFLERK